MFCADQEDAPLKHRRLHYFLFGGLEAVPFWIEQDRVRHKSLWWVYYIAIGTVGAKMSNTCNHCVYNELPHWPILWFRLTNIPVFRPSARRPLPAGRPASAASWPPAASPQAAAAAGRRAPAGLGPIGPMGPHGPNGPMTPMWLH